jgi:hypothetical protein
MLCQDYWDNNRFGNFVCLRSGCNKIFKKGLGNSGALDRNGTGRKRMLKIKGIFPENQGLVHENT